MNKETFLLELGRLLSDLSLEEKQEAMAFYEEYFMEAGEEQEEQVLRELGSPQEVSYKIHEELAGKELICYDAVAGQRERTNNTNDDSSVQGKDENDKKTGKQKKKAPVNGWKIACIVILCLIALPIAGPIAFGLGAAALVIVIAIVASVFAVLFALVVTVLALVVSAAIVGVVFLILGILKLITAPFAALILLGLSLIMLGAFILCCWLLVKLCMVVVPAVAKGIWKLICLPFRKKEGTAS